MVKEKKGKSSDEETKIENENLKDLLKEERYKNKSYKSSLVDLSCEETNNQMELLTQERHKEIEEGEKPKNKRNWKSGKITTVHTRPDYKQLGGGSGKKSGRQPKKTTRKSFEPSSSSDDNSEEEDISKADNNEFLGLKNALKESDDEELLNHTLVTGEVERDIDDWEIAANELREFVTACPGRTKDDADGIVEVVNHCKQTSRNAELLAVFNNGERMWGDKYNIWPDAWAPYKNSLEGNKIDITELYMHIDDAEDKDYGYFEKELTKTKRSTTALPKKVSKPIEVYMCAFLFQITN